MRELFPVGAMSGEFDNLFQKRQRIVHEYFHLAKKGQKFLFLDYILDLACKFCVMCFVLSDKKINRSKVKENTGKVGGFLGKKVGTLTLVSFCLRCLRSL